MSSCTSLPVTSGVTGTVVTTHIHTSRKPLSAGTHTHTNKSRQRGWHALPRILQPFNWCTFAQNGYHATLKSVDTHTHRHTQTHNLCCRRSKLVTHAGYNSTPPSPKKKAIMQINWATTIVAHVGFCCGETGKGKTGRCRDNRSSRQ